MNLERLYLDYNATSPLSESVLNWLKSGDLLFANPSSQHTDGKSSRKSINESKTNILNTFSLKEKERKLWFHSGATEAFHTLASSFAEMTRLKGQDLLICYSQVDHPAVTSLGEKFLGSHVKTLELNRHKDLTYDHQKNLEAIKDKKDNNPDLVILYHHLWVHNETGLVSPLEELNSLKGIPDLFIHVDAVQAPGKISDWNVLKVGDIFTFSGHKFGSLKGVGFTLMNQSFSFHSMISGGGQQGNMRSGTENLHGIISLSLALNDLKKVDPKKTLAQRNSLRDFLQKNLNGEGVVIDHQNCASNTIYFYLNRFTSDIALALFDIQGLEISAGSACSSGAAKDSKVLLHMGESKTAKNGLRLSLPLDFNEEFLNEVQKRLSTIINKLRAS